MKTKQFWNFVTGRGQFMNQEIFNHNWIQLLYYITALIHSPETYFLKGSLFLKLKLLRISQALSRKHFWTNILLLLLQTANTMVETRAWARVTSGVTQIWRDTSRWCHDHCHAASVSRWCDEETRGKLETRGGLSGDWAQKTRDVIIKRGAFKTNEFLHVALIKTTRNN